MKTAVDLGGPQAGHIYTGERERKDFLPSLKSTLPKSPGPLVVGGLCVPTRLIGADLKCGKNVKCMQFITKPRLFFGNQPYSRTEERDPAARGPWF